MRGKSEFRRSPALVTVQMGETGSGKATKITQ
jgi:hypothetical protein